MQKNKNEIYYQEKCKEKTIGYNPNCIMQQFDYLSESYFVQ